MERDMPPIHPGEILMEDFLKPMGITRYRLAKSISVSQRRIGEIVSGNRSITADTALRLARFFGTDAQSWMNLQTHYDLAVTEESISDRLGKRDCRHVCRSRSCIYLVIPRSRPNIFPVNPYPLQSGCSTADTAY